jgi:hypothetical protein
MPQLLTGHHDWQQFAVSHSAANHPAIISKTRRGIGVGVYLDDELGCGGRGRADDPGLLRLVRGSLDRFAPSRGRVDQHC